ncbi:hypothetical protein Z517_09279 [Fonsecaea pedrosoi CBS 271.37]|uniref:Uncharacterized protein n=1 Tax=Fonsecaea pedrosoi CBS 271.37 TaxID=1442368 RepID=A0A0D2GDT9_9EURO|nr:uncharacterized protein Z517_09279 [Fonsecaea pedrosoi CBS 271.37]KIW76835.1 hypothetical protein Z517_09279 [Fonsecaea pedrosoi CBS 271.37]
MDPKHHQSAQRRDSALDIDNPSEPGRRRKERTISYGDDNLREISERLVPSIEDDSIISKTDALESRVADLEAPLVGKSESLSDAVNSLKTETTERKRLEEVGDLWQSKSEEQDRAIHDLQTHISKQTAVRASAHRGPPVESFSDLHPRAQPPYPQPQEEGYDIARDLNDYHSRQPTPASRSRAAQSPASSRPPIRPMSVPWEEINGPESAVLFIASTLAGAAPNTAEQYIPVSQYADPDKVWRSAVEAIEYFDKVYAERHRDKSAEIEYEWLPGVTVVTYMAPKSVGASDLVPMVEFFVSAGDRKLHMLTRDDRLTNTLSKHVFQPSSDDPRASSEWPWYPLDNLELACMVWLLLNGTFCDEHPPARERHFRDFTQKLDERLWRKVKGCEPDSYDDLVDYYKKKKRKILTSDWRKKTKQYLLPRPVDRREKGKSSKLTKKAKLSNKKVSGRKRPSWAPNIKDAQVKAGLQVRNACLDCGEVGCRPGRPECKLTKHYENVSAVQEDDGTSDSEQSYVPCFETESDHDSSDESLN